ncbi:MAG TPA: ROK family protein [Solirubrobacteraceae bacterium]|jgi:glucokinase|nr:ROK family protein [Solirubrobacteraceae bacterium]
MLADRPTESDRRERAGRRFVIGVDLGGTKILAGAVDTAGVVGRAGLAAVHRAGRPAPKDSVEAVLETVADLVAEVGRAVDGRVDAVGFGIPCVIDAGRAASSVHLPIVDFPFAEAISERVGLAAFVDNDANLALLAEHRAGAAAGVRDAVMLTLGTGIGGGLLIDGEIYRGSRGGAGELGHMVVWADGPDCGPGCPSRGCLESVASGTALVREARRLAADRPESALGRAQAGGTQITGPLVTRLAEDGDEAAGLALDRLGRWLGVGLGSIANIFDPELIVIGGGVIAAGDLILGPARAVLAARALPPAATAVRVAAAHFGAESGMLGAAVFAYESINRRTVG